VAIGASLATVYGARWREERRIGGVEGGMAPRSASWESGQAIFVGVRWRMKCRDGFSRDSFGGGRGPGSLGRDECLEKLEGCLGGHHCVSFFLK
jgi:hypothetical protein